MLTQIEQANAPALHIRVFGYKSSVDIENVFIKHGDLIFKK
jgi:hypothetical protein